MTPYVEDKASLLGERIAVALRDKRVSQRSIAPLIGVDQATVSNWIKGRSYPNAYNLLCLSEVLQIPVGYFFGEVSEKQADTETRIQTLEKQVSALMEFVKDSVK